MPDLVGENAGAGRLSRPLHARRQAKRGRMLLACFMLTGCKWNEADADAARPTTSHGRGMIDVSTAVATGSVGRAGGRKISHRGGRPTLSLPSAFGLPNAAIDLLYTWVRT